MKKSKSLLSAIVFVAVISFAAVQLQSCGWVKRVVSSDETETVGESRNDTLVGVIDDSSDETETVRNDTWPERQPNVVKVYIDASGSMRDYFGENNITNVSDALTGLGQATESLEAEYYVWNGDGKHIPISQEDLTTRLIKKDLKGKSSTFDKIFREMVKLSTPDTLTVLLSDGIMSSSSGQTKLSKSFTDYDKGHLKTEIQKAMRGTNKAVSIYRIMGDFDGSYYDKGNNQKNYSGSRPFYVFVIGDKDNVRYFDTKARKGKIHKVYANAESIHMNSAPNMPFMIEPTDGDGEMASFESFNRTEGTSKYEYPGTIGFRVKGRIPNWVKETYGSNVIREMSEISVDEKPLRTKPTIEDGAISFDIPEAMVTELNGKSNPYVIRYRMHDPARKAWDKYSTDDDTQPDSIHTYLLQDLVEALYKGVSPDKEALLESTITIIPN